MQLLFNQKAERFLSVLIGSYRLRIRNIGESIWINIGKLSIPI